jgi:hypothetical protein
MQPTPARCFISPINPTNLQKASNPILRGWPKDTASPLNTSPDPNRSKSQEIQCRGDAYGNLEKSGSSGTQQPRLTA